MPSADSWEKILAKTSADSRNAPGSNASSVIIADSRNAPGSNSSWIIAADSRNAPGSNVSAAPDIAFGKKGYTTEWTITLCNVRKDHISAWKNYTAKANLREFVNERLKLKEKIIKTVNTY